MTNGYGLFFIEDRNRNYPEGVVLWILMPHADVFTVYGVRYGDRLHDRIRTFLGYLPRGMQRVRDFRIMQAELRQRRARTRITEERQSRVMVPQYAESRRRRYA